MSAKHKDTSRRELLWSPMCWEADAASGSRGTRMWQNFTSEQTQKANFDFVPGFVCLAMPRRESLGLHARLALRRKSLPPAALCSFTSDRTCQLFLETGSVPRLDRGGISQECASRRMSCSFLCCQPEWNVMSCQDDCEAISELSGVRSVTFVVGGSWCLPGACGPNWGLFAEPGELLRLLWLTFTPAHQWFFGFCFHHHYWFPSGVTPFFELGNRVEKRRVRGSSPVVVITWCSGSRGR